MRALIVALFVSGCSHSAAVVSNAHPVVPSSSMNASGTAAAVLLIGTAVIAASQEPGAPQAGSTSATFSGWSTQPVPEMAPERGVALQDCTKPVDLSAGNLRCR